MPPTHNPTMPRIGHVQATMRPAPSFAERRAALIEAWQRAQALAVGGLYKCQRCAVLRVAAGVPHREGSR